MSTSTSQVALRRRGRSHAANYALFGAGVGLGFVLVGTVVAALASGSAFSLQTMLRQHVSSPLLWIIDTAPLVLALFARAAGARQDRLSSLEQNVTQRQADLERARIDMERTAVERAQHLETTNRDLERRARRLQVVGQISREIASMQDAARIAATVPGMIAEGMEIYHVGLFTLDDERRNAILSGASSPGGRRMLTRGHSLRVGVTGLVGNVARFGAIRVARDVGADPFHAANPDLPDTRSEAALPLTAGDQIIGVLDVQGTEVNAFDAEELEALQLIADQTASAMMNARQMASTRAALLSLSQAGQRELEMAAGEQGAIGFEALPDGRVVRITGPSEQPDKELVSTGRPRIVHGESGSPPLIEMPVRLRDRIIGFIRVRAGSLDRHWGDDEIALLENVADRAATALENAGLISASQRQADKERVIREISASIGASTRIDSIVQSAARELSRALGGSEVLVQIEPGPLTSAPKGGEQQ